MPPPRDHLTTTKEQDAESRNRLRLPGEDGPLPRPGLSLALISDFRLEGAMAYGAANAETRAPVTTDTIFQAGSVSKALTAAAALQAVTAGRLALDENINHFLHSGSFRPTSSPKPRP